ncbi:hypothetical protein WISP_18855 [Willisornis vidua]|uniref:Uncharacterized protein n=1 Tax=Willisornis vidua TaxID=1566151 RepID=A0ABQ9DPL6_9PASS|nr:hypothetical protein WISP_18855 [Willisornis vidua]
MSGHLLGGWALTQAVVPIEAFIPEKTSYDMEYLFCQFGSAVLLMSPPRIWTSPILLSQDIDHGLQQLSGHRRFSLSCSSKKPQIFNKGLPSFERENSSSAFCVIWKLAQYRVQSCIEAIYEDIEEHKAQDGVMWNPTSDKLPVLCQPIHYYSLCLTCTPMAHPPHDVFIQLCAGHFVQKDPGRDSIGSFTEIQNDYINRFPLISYVGYHKRISDLISRTFLS